MGKDCEAINFYKSWERLVFIDHYQYPVVKVSGIRLRGQAVKTSPFHGGNTGSIPVGVIFLYGPLAQLVRATGS